MFCVLKKIAKNVEVNVFQKHRQNIASKKYDVLHDVLGSGIQSYEKNPTYSAKKLSCIAFIYLTI